LYMYKFFSKNEVYYKSPTSLLLKGDCLNLMKKIPDETISLIVTDPPYFLSNNGITCKSGKMVSVNKGDWDKKNSIQEVDEFNEQWLSECKRILKKDGTMWVFGTSHNIFSIGYLLRKLEYKILNTITWVKKSPPPNLSCRVFTHSTEIVIWSKKSEKSKQTFNYSLMKEINGGKQMKDVWVFGRPLKIEQRHGKHPTQKPEDLVERIVKSSSNSNDIVLDLFCGSGTTGVVSVRNKRYFVGIDLEKEYLEVSKKRIIDESN